MAEQSATNPAQVTASACDQFSTDLRQLVSRAETFARFDPAWREIAFMLRDAWENSPEPADG